MIVASWIIGALICVPTIWSQPPDWLEPLVPEKGAKLGLDLQGGMHLVLEVDTDAAVENRVRHFRNRLEQWAEKKGAVAAIEQNGPAELKVSITPMPDDFDDFVADFGGTFEVDHKVGPSAVVRIPQAELRRIRDWAVLQSLETIRNRIDQYGVSEPSIQRQGDDRIVVQLPGVDDPERAIKLIGRTAQLTFHLVRDDVQAEGLTEAIDALIAAHPEFKRDVRALNAALAATLPTGVEVRFQRVADEFGSFTQPILVSAEPEMSGDTVVDARVRIEQQFNEPYVLLQFNEEGAEQFAELTAENVGKRLAIVLDEMVYSAPVIREKIGGGRASIEGGFTIDEARDLAIVLRAGSLPADVSILEERTVGPSLGQDSIERGVRAIVVGGLLVVLFMAFYYRYAGIVADVSLFANLIYLMAILSLFGATLTLPGLAGIVLTIGMAVDGNVIIFERIREELRLGKSVRSAVETGYSKALSTVLDANVTTLIAGLILFQFGTGPVRGFAVTLTVGILTTLVSVLFVSRTLIDMYVQRRGVRSLPI
ncbi:MAG: protein translocase subunit SecD [Candidatus Dadabacteria bacterium]|nr:MAG: protein translocase subunit SecD [Candidatus Dadabacteria bacterium]